MRLCKYRHFMQGVPLFCCLPVLSHTLLCSAPSPQLTLRGQVGFSMYLFILYLARFVSLIKHILISFPCPRLALSILYLWVTVVFIPSSPSCPFCLTCPFLISLQMVSKADLEAFKKPHSLIATHCYSQINKPYLWFIKKKKRLRTEGKKIHSGHSLYETTKRVRMFCEWDVYIDLMELTDEKTNIPMGQ